MKNPQKKNSSVTAPGAHILLGFYDAWSFETPRINNQSVTELIALNILGDENEHKFETPQKIIMVSLYQVPRFFRI